MLLNPENILEVGKERFLIHQKIQTEKKELFYLVSKIDKNEQLIKGHATILKESNNHVENLPLETVVEILPLFFK